MFINEKAFIKVLILEKGVFVIKNTFLFVIIFSLIFYNKIAFSKNTESQKINFSKKFIDLVSNGYLDKNGFDYLKKLEKSEDIEDKKFAKQTISNLINFKERIKLEYTIEDVDNNKNINLNFVFTPTYSENDKIAGKTIYDIISNISQKDNLDETKSDDDRCGTSSLVNAYLIMGGNLKKLTKEFSLNNDLTYKNIHLIQEKLYDIANVDKINGIYSGFKYKSFLNGSITDIRPSGEILYASDKIGITIIPLIGKTVKTIDNKKLAVEDFLKKNPKGVLQVGVYLDAKNGNLIKPSANFPQNHFITIFKINNTYYVSDTSHVNNGDGKNVKKLSNIEVNELIYNTSGIINGLLLNNIKFY